MDLTETKPKNACQYPTELNQGGTLFWNKSYSFCLTEILADQSLKSKTNAHYIGNMAQSCSLNATSCVAANYGKCFP